MDSVTRLGVSSITLDPLYNISNGQNDLAILTLAQKATFSFWGLNYYNSTDAERPDVLQVVDVYVTSNEECQKAFKNYTTQGQIGE